MSDHSQKLSDFQNTILDFYAAHRRVLPWRETTSIYEVAVSEFMLQQTQVSRVIPKYKEFLRQFPSPASLRDASQADVLSAWQGLGYNRRALWLQGLADFLTLNPQPTYDELITVKGVGSYTAAAILSFANNANVAAVDVNIARIFNRYFGGVSKSFIQEALPVGRSREWHNALMDFGSQVCTKRNPSCESCPLADSCFAYQHDTFAEEKSHSQPAFVGSLRWHRGQILKILLATPLTQQQLFSRLDTDSRDRDKFETAIAQYLDEEFLILDGELLRVKQ